MNLGPMPLRTRNALKLLLFAVLALAVVAPDACAQYFRFGKNKVQYRDLDWHFLQSTHFDVFYYEPGGEALATFTARAAEEALTEIADLFDYRITDRIAILVYQGHNDFAVTNAVDLPAFSEGIAGVTELYKNRVALPFNGDYREYRRVLHHEIVHAVVNDMFYGGSLQRIIQSGTRLRLPLWFNEGLAEFSALGWDTHSDMYIREAIARDRLSDVEDLWGYFAYHGGQGFFDYVATEFGREKITEVIQLTRAGGSVSAAFSRATGMSLSELSSRWHQALRAAHFPEVAAREDLASVARVVVSAEDGGRYNTGAAISPAGDRIAFLSAREALFDVYVVDAAGGEPRRLIAGQTNPQFESFRVLTPGISWNPAGSRLAVAVKSGATDAIALVDVQTRRTRHHRIEGIDAILSVRWSPDGSRIAFSGTSGGSSDIYVLDLEDGAVTNLTRDVFSDLEPAWSPDSDRIVFHSDRGDHLETGVNTAGEKDLTEHDYGQFSLYAVDLDNPGTLTRLTHDPDWDDTSASFGLDPDQLLFISDRNGVANLYELTISSGEVRPLTDLFVGVMQVSLSRDARSAALVALREGVPSIYLLRDPFEREVEAPLAPTVFAQRVMGDRVQRQAPSLAVAHPTTLRENPFLRDAASPTPFLADVVRRKRLPPELREAPQSVADTTATGTQEQFISDTYRERAVVDSLVLSSDRVDFRSYDFSDSFDEAAEARQSPRTPRRERFNPVDNVDEDGSFRTRPYRLRFTPDLIYGSLGYDAIFGVQSFTQMSFSDLLGNHRVSASTNLVIDLRNSDYILSYQYLPQRTNYAVTTFHVARQLTDFNRQAFFRYRNYGAIVSASYPLDKFRRVEGEVSFQGVSLTDLMDPTLRSRSRGFFFPALSFTADHSVPGLLTPSRGRRYAVRVSGTPGPAVTFASILVDGRQYFGSRYYTVGLRLAGGASVGPEAQRFYAAGVQNWINPNIAGIPIRDENDFVFGTPILPLRGHAFEAASGDRFALFNVEARFPIVAALLPGPVPILPLYHLQGTAFVDVAAIADGEFNARREDEDGQRVFDDLYAGAGVGLRTIVLGYPLRFDWAWPHDGRRFGDARFYLSIGLDF